MSASAVSKNPFDLLNVDEDGVEGVKPEKKEVKDVKKAAPTDSKGPAKGATSAPAASSAPAPPSGIGKPLSIASLIALLNATISRPLPSKHLSGT